MKSALLVIDVQRALFEPAPADADAVVERINALAQAARRAGAAVIFVQHETGHGALAAESEGWQLLPALQVAASDQRVRKTTPDAFLRTDLPARLHEQGIQRVVVCGYACEFCVDTTVRRAAALGYAVTLAADAHTTHDKPHAGAGQIRAHHNATLPGITSFGVRIEAVVADRVRFG